MRALLVIVLGIALVSGGVWMQYQDFLSTPIELGEDSLLLEVERGTALRGLSEELTERGLMDHPYFFIAMAYLTDNATRLKAGEFEIPNGVTPPQLLELLTSGKVVQRAFTFVEGWTYRDALAAVAKDERFEKVLGEDPSGGDDHGQSRAPGRASRGALLPRDLSLLQGRQRTGDPAAIL